MRARRRHPAAAGLAAMFLLLAIGGCDLGDLLDVQDPNKATADDIDDPDNLPAVRAHAVGEFQVGYAGRGAANDNAFVLMSGLLSDEYEASGTFPTRVEVDQRNVRTTNTTAQQTFRIMHRGRAAAELSYRAHEMHAQGSPAQAEAAVLAGFMYNAFGEMYCSGVPFSRLDAADPEYGEPLATEQIFEEAIGWFDSAGSIATGPEAEDEALAAAVGRARALLNLGDVAQAATAVASVPTGFTFAVLHDAATERQWNGVWDFVNNVERWRIPDSEGGTGLPYRTDGTEADASGTIIAAGDPRIVWYEAGPAFDNNVTQYSQLRYPTREAATPVATGIEARLIEAEAALAADDTDGFLAIHNALRATMDGLDPLAPADVAGFTPDDYVDLHFRERAYWLWQSGHRLGDLRRLVRQYGRDAAAVFPGGTYHKGGGYGTDLNFPIPVDEENNPNFESCFDREA